MIDVTAHKRIDRLEAKVDDHNAKLGEVAEGVSWIKGYLKTAPNPAVPVFKRDAGMVAGGGGIVGAIVVAIEMFLNR